MRKRRRNKRQRDPGDITGRPMTGWVMVDPGGLRDDAALTAWVEQAVEFVRGLPKK